MQEAGCDSLNQLLMMEKVAQVAYELGEINGALAIMEDMIQVCQKSGDKLGEAHATKRAAEAHAESYHTRDALRFAKQAQELFEELDIADEIDEVKTLQTTIYVKRLQHNKAPNRKKALSTLRSFVKAVEARETDQVKQLEVDLDKVSSALKEDEMKDALEALFSRDEGALKYLEGLGWELSSFKNPTIIFQFPHKLFYLTVNGGGGILFGPAYRAVNPYRVNFVETEATSMNAAGARSCSVCQMPDIETWQECVQYRTGILDAAIQVQSLAGWKPITYAEADILR